MPIRWRLAELMKERKWTAYRLAKESGLTPSAIYKLLKKPDIGYVDVETLEALAAALDVDPLSLLRHSKK